MLNGQNEIGSATLNHDQHSNNYQNVRSEFMDVGMSELGTASPRKEQGPFKLSGSQVDQADNVAGNYNLTSYKDKVG